jgi:hypothetical protein
MASPVIQIRRGPSANVGLTTLKLGEPGFTTDRYELYVGTGSTITLGINTITSQLITAPNNKFLGSANYWSRETELTGGGVNLLESTGSGNNYITLAAPTSLGSNIQYTFPEAPVDGAILQTNSTGGLSWTSSINNITLSNANVGFLTVSNTSRFIGTVTFENTTDSTTKDNGSVVFDGGIGIEKSVNIGGNLQVSGISTFVGEVTFKGGTINIGDQTTDDIFVGGEFASNLGPSTTNTYDIGDFFKSWRNIFVQSVYATGISTIGGFLDANGGLDVQGATDLDDLRVSGISTFSSNLDINAGMEVDGEVDLNSNLSVIGISTFNGPIDANNNLTVDGSVGITSDFTVTGFSTFQNAVVMNSTLNVSSHTKLNTSLDVTGIATVGGFFDANNGADIFGHTELDSLNVSGIATFTSAFATNLTVTNEITGTITTSRTVDTTETTANGEYFITFTDNSTSQFGETIRVSAGASFNPSTRTLTAQNLRSSAVKAVDGTSAITITSQSGHVGVASNLTVSGDLYVLGTSVEVNTETLKVEDSLIEVGLINTGGMLGAPTSDLNIDVGILMHWYSAGAKKAAAFWDDSASRIVLASDVSETSSVISVNTYASLEIGDLWINDCAGQSQLISCVGSERLLNNITVDGGSF